ncbi:hypothetical protein [Levilactobacillus bambusae]|uniref:Uncharacterized protein n=1 Tax=Levilactobacillus bambusae TaxID=2024736 RepID=A0A2V1MYA3_9LACO|nr:hypothetical protein [Levilactobacillus bambusae]PWF99752.1 hypothetical protein DCM90_06740 [Levilactobacillus bambusae]
MTQKKTSSNFNKLLEILTSGRAAVTAETLFRKLDTKSPHYSIFSSTDQQYLIRLIEVLMQEISYAQTILIEIFA